MNISTIQQLDAQYVAPTYGRFPICIVEGKGCVCKDTEGNAYLDFTAGIGVNALGYCHPAWVEAVCAQAQTLNHTSNLYYTLPGTRLAERLCKASGMREVFFANSGAEANEGVIKAARKYGSDHFGPAHTQIICLENSFHGRTITTLSATGQAGFHTHFTPFTQGFSFAKANDLQSVVQVAGDDTCAVFLEMVQGEGGVVPLTKEFVGGVAALCAQNGWLLMVDEVQTGIGRTGTLFAYQQFGIQPDLVSAAKGLGGGLPIGAVLLGQRVAGTLGAGTHGSTFGANPIACAGAHAVLDALTDAFLQEVACKGAYLKTQLLSLPHVVAVDGMGLMLGVTFDDMPSIEVVNACLKKGVLFLTAKQKLRLLPPLTITREEIDQGIAVLREVLTNWGDAQ